MRRVLVLSLVLASALAAAGAAQAVVVTDGGAGSFGVAYVPNVERWTGFGAVTAPSPCQDPWLSPDLGGPLVPNNSAYTRSGLCYHGGSVIHANEVFDISWDPLRQDWESTRYYVEHFLRNVADSSDSQGTALATPYSISAQYRDSGGRAADQSVYGGGCIDYGLGGGSACQLGGASSTPPGNNYPGSGCPIVGTNQFGQTLGGEVLVSEPNNVCLTDAQIQNEVTALANQAGFVSRAQSGYTPLVVLMTPPGVVDCLDSAGTACSSNVETVPPMPVVNESDTGGSWAKGAYEVEVTEQLPSGETVASAPASVSTGTSTATITVSPPTQLDGATSWSVYVTAANDNDTFYRQASGLSFGSSLTMHSGPYNGVQPPVHNDFCSYHSSVTVGGTRVPYVVQPWTALTSCDEPDSPQIPTPAPPPDVLASDVGARLVSPLSQAELAAITDPYLDGWYALDGSEINDNGQEYDASTHKLAHIGCVPLGNNLDKVTVGDSSYNLQREFNNGGMLVTDPNALGCAPSDGLQAQFVVPSSVDPGDVVEFDGSKSVSTLVVPQAGYAWNFGDGTTATGASVVHTYSKNGTYNVTLTITDRGGYSTDLSQKIQVGPPVTATTTTTTTTTTTATKPPKVTLKARLTLLPQSLKSVLKSGVAVRITSNLKADGLTTLLLPKAYAKQAHLHVTRSATVVIGRGTIAGVKAGTMTLHVKVPSSTAKRLAKLRRLTLTLQVALRGPSSTHMTIDAAGRY